MSFNDTPRANRLHIGIFGRRNSGKSSLINALTGQDIALVSDAPGTTTDPVFKAMELHPVGPVVFIDTAGFDDEGQLGRLRVERTREVVAKTDLAILVIDGSRLSTDAFGDLSGGPQAGRGPSDDLQTDPQTDFQAADLLAEQARSSGGPQAGRGSDDDLQTDLQTDFQAADLATGQTDLPDLELTWERQWIAALEKQRVPILIAVNKTDLCAGAPQAGRGSDADLQADALSSGRPLQDALPTDAASQPDVLPPGESLEDAGSRDGDAGQDDSPFFSALRGSLGDHPVIPVSAAEGTGLDVLREAIRQLVRPSEDQIRRQVLEGLVTEGDLVMLVMPQDIQAPKGRLILPQVQTLRELLDRKCTVASVTADGFTRGLAALSRDPDLIITDSQCFSQVYEKKPEVSRLTSFSVLFAAFKGNVESFVKGASQLGYMTENSKVLIAEACTHVPLSEDIGREKIPKLLRQKFGSGIEIINVCGNDFPEPEGLAEFDLIIHCGACMFNRRHVLSRIAAAEAAGVPITNYGIVLAELTGILDKVELPETPGIAR